MQRCGPVTSLPAHTAPTLREVREGAMCRIGSTVDPMGPRLTFEPCLMPNAQPCSGIALLWELWCLLAQPETEALLVSRSPSTEGGDGPTFGVWKTLRHS